MPEGRFLSLTSDVMEKEGICFRHNAELLADVVLFLYFSISRSISLHHCSVLCVQLHLFAVERCAKWGQANISFLGGMVHRGLVGLQGHKGHLRDRTSLWARWGWCVTVFWDSENGVVVKTLWLGNKKKKLAYIFQRFSDLVDEAEDCLLTFFHVAVSQVDFLHCFPA